uniref:DUF834 domain-containing protein n=1 Tax=Oryza glumipatula TaxID=40148 RepID=A0A0E0B8Z1_9ORYZ
MSPFIASSLILPVGVLILRIEGRGGARASSGTRREAPRLDGWRRPPSWLRGERNKDNMAQGQNGKRKLGLVSKGIEVKKEEEE